VDDCHRLASCYNYIASRIAGIRPPSATRDKVTVSVVLQRESDQPALALYTITIDRVYITARIDVTPKTTEQNRIACTSKSEAEVTNNKQELSHRKQIARQLRTQYVESIYKPNYTVTVKSRLMVTQGHWKRNHWVDHTRLTISRVT